MEDNLLLMGFSFRMTLALPTSEPVPAVVGTATTGAMPVGSARVHQSPTSSKSHSGRAWPDMNRYGLAGVERRSAAKGHDAIVAAGAISAKSAST